MTHLLPPNLLKLFAPRPPLIYVRPVDKNIDRVRAKAVSGIAACLALAQEENVRGLVNGGKRTKDGADGAEEGEEVEERAESFTLAEETKRQLRREERKKKKEDEFQKAKASYKPSEDKEAVGDPYKTLFIARLNKNVTEADLRRAFEPYGPLERVRIVREKKGRSRGYAFIVYDRERDMKAAYKEADKMLILGKPILVDVERGRTVRGWKPRRLGGGLGGRVKKPDFVDMRGGGGGGGGGFRGGGRGGFRGGRGDFRGGSFRGGFGGGGPDRGPRDFGDRGGPRDFGDRGGGADRGGGGQFRGGGAPYGDRDRSGFDDRGGFRGGFRANEANELKRDSTAFDSDRDAKRSRLY